MYQATRMMAGEYSWQPSGERFHQLCVSVPFPVSPNLTPLPLGAVGKVTPSLFSTYSRQGLSPPANAVGAQGLLAL